MITAVAAEEPEPAGRLRSPDATGGIVTGPGLTLGTDGCVWPPSGPRTVAYPAGNVSVTIDLSRCLEPYRSFRTTAYVGEPIREIEE